MQQYEAYPFVLNEGKTHYHFQSIGKRGVFEMVIAFSPLTNTIYNLALLDVDAETGDYVDDTVTDNGDMPQILATVMSVIMLEIVRFVKATYSRYEGPGKKIETIFDLVS